MAKPLTSRPKKLSALIQWVTRTTAECRGESRLSETLVASPGRDVDLAIAMPRSYHGNATRWFRLVSTCQSNGLAVEVPLSAAPRIVGDTGKFCSNATCFKTRLISFGLGVQVIELKRGRQGAWDCLARLGWRMWTWAPTLLEGKQLDMLTTEAIQAPPHRIKFYLLINATAVFLSSDFHFKTDIRNTAGTLLMGLPAVIQAYHL
jgi:hypothetical protein